MEKQHKKGPLAPFHAGLQFSFFDGIAWMIASVTPMILFLQELGGTPFQVGLAYSFAYLMLPLQVVGTALIPHLGFQGQMVGMWSIRSFFLVIPLFLAYLAPENPQSWMSSLFVFSFFMFCMLRAVGHSALYPWLYELLPINLRGRYFATDQLLVNFAGVIALLLSSYCLYAFTLYNAFLLIYCVAIVGSIIAVIALKKLRNTSHNKHNTSLRAIWDAIPRLCFKSGPFRQYLLISIVWFFVGIPYIPFTIYYMKDVMVIADSMIVFYMVLQYVSAMIVGWLLRLLLDHFRVRRFFIISMLTCIWVKIHWYFVVGGSGIAEKFLWSIFIVNGVSTILWQSAQFKYLPQLCSREDRPIGTALQLAITGIVGGIAPVLWGILLQGQIDATQMNVSSLKVYFVVASVVMTFLILPYWNLKQDHSILPSRGFKLFVDR